MTAIAITGTPDQFYPPSPGASDASWKLRELREQAARQFRATEIWKNSRGDLQVALRELDETYRECSKEDWDGYGALPVSQEAYHEATRFLKAWPLSLPVPELGPEPEGDIGFEWNFGKNKVFAVSVHGSNFITYAGLLGAGNKTHGTEAFDGAIPQEIINKILRIHPEHDATG